MQLGKFYEKNKAITIIAILYILVFIADLISTLNLKELYPYLEANVLFSTVGIYGIFIFNVILITAALWAYQHFKEPHSRFIILLAVVTFTIIRILVVFENIKLGLNPPTLEEAKAVTSVMKINAITFYTKLNLVSYVIGVITYLLFLLDHRVSNKK